MSASHQSMASLLECPICLEAFKDPRMLTSCLHSLCYKCLGDHITHAGGNGQFQCPVCRQSQQIPEDGADAFPKNFFINSCMDAVTDQGSEARSTTRQGSRGGRHGTRENECSNAEDLQCTQPEQFCLDCSEYYCKICSKLHLKPKATRSHVLVALDDLTDDLLRDAMAKSETPRCQKHQKKLKLYCSTCQCAVCSVCCHISHQSHTFREISEVDEDLKSELSRAMASLKGIIDDGIQQTNQIQLSQQRAEKTTTTARETTKNVFQKMKQMSDQKAKEIDQKICKINQDSEGKTNVQSKNLTLHSALLESLHTFTDDLLKRGTVYNRLASLPDVRNRIKEFQGSPLASADGATVTEIPNSADLVAKHLDGIVLRQQVNLGGPASARGPILVIRTTCSISKLCVVLYYMSHYGWGRRLVDVAVQSLKTRLTCDVSETDTIPLQPEVTARPQVDVIACYEDNIDSVVKDYNITESTAGQRHLVLVHYSYGSLTKTRHALGQHVRHFQAIIWCGYNDASHHAAIVSLAVYFLQAVGAR